MTLYWLSLVIILAGMLAIFYIQYIENQIPKVWPLLVKYESGGYMRLSYVKLCALDDSEFYIIEKNSADLENRFYKRSQADNAHLFHVEGQEVCVDKFVTDCADLNVYSEIHINKPISLGCGLRWKYSGSQRHYWHDCVLKM